jgi:hypothetical protein
VKCQSRVGNIIRRANQVQIPTPTKSSIQNVEFIEAHDFFASLLHNETKREDFKEIHLGMGSIVRVLNTQRRKFDTAKLRFLGNKIYMLMVKTFPRAAICKSLHPVLGHGWEVVKNSISAKIIGKLSERSELC